MRLTVIALFFYSFCFSIDTPNNQKTVPLVLDQMPEIMELERDPSDFIGKWRVINNYGSDFFYVSSDSDQTIVNPGQFHGYVPIEEGLTITTQADTVDLNYAYIDSGLISFFTYSWGTGYDETPSKTLVLSNTPITKNDRLISSGNYFPPGNPDYNSVLLGIYEGNTYPRYLYTATILQSSFHPGVSSLQNIQFLHIWHDEYTVEYYIGDDDLIGDSTSILYSDYVDFSDKTIQFDSILVSLPEGDLYGTFDFIFNGYLEPDSILIPSDVSVSALDYYWAQPSVLIDPNADFIIWVFNEDFTGSQTSTQIYSWNPDGVYYNRDTIPLTWEAQEDSVLIIFNEQDSLLMSYGLISDTLYLGSEFIFCHQGNCDYSIPSLSPAVYDTLDVDWFETLTGLSSINSASMDIGVAMRLVFSDAQIMFNPYDILNNQMVFSTYSVGSSQHAVQFFNVGTDTLEWSIEPPSESWITMVALSGNLAPDSSQTLAFTINGESLASDTEYSIDLTIYSNDDDDPVTVVPMTIQVNPPDLYMVGLNNNSFTIEEDDTLETVFYVIGPQGNTTFSISGDTSSISGNAVIDDEYVPNSISNYSLRATLFVIPDHNWYGQTTIYITADNEYDYTDTDTLTIEVTSVYDQIVEPQMVFPPNGHTIYFETMIDSISFVWNSAGYPDFETGPGFEYRLRIVQSNETGNIPYNYTDLTDTTFTFFPDSSTYSGLNNNYIWSLYTTEENLPEVLSGLGGVFFVILPAMNIESNEIPNDFMLYNAFPNPFNPNTTIRFDIPEASFVSIDVYDMMGRHIKGLVKQNILAGRRSINWNGTNDLEQPVSAGTYFYTIQSGKHVQTKKMILLK